MGKAEENKQQKRNSLLQTAFELFTTKGETKTSISDIADNAGVAKGTFYLYFRDKIDIKNKLIAHKTEKIFETALEKLDAAELESFSDKVIFIVDNILDQLTENPVLLRFIYKNLSWGVFRNVIESENKNGESELYDVYNRIISENKYDIKEPEVMMYLIIELVSSSSYSSILYSEPLPIDKLKPHIFNTVRNIISQYQIV